VVIEACRFVDSLHPAIRKNKIMQTNRRDRNPKPCWERSAQGALEATAKIELMTKPLNQKEPP